MKGKHLYLCGEDLFQFGYEGKKMEAVMLSNQEEEAWQLHLCGEELFQFGYEGKRS